MSSTASPAPSLEGTPVSRQGDAPTQQEHPTQEERPTQEEGLTQEQVLGKIYRDLARLAAEVAVDRCRYRALARLATERLGLSPEALEEAIQRELKDNLQTMCETLTRPMLAELEEMQAPTVGGCCQA